MARSAIVALNPAIDNDHEGGSSSIYKSTAGLFIIILDIPCHKFNVWIVAVPSLFYIIILTLR